jgi:hypothetical protein
MADSSSQVSTDCPTQVLSISDSFDFGAPCVTSTPPPFVTKKRARSDVSVITIHSSDDDSSSGEESSDSSSSDSCVIDVTADEEEDGNDDNDPFAARYPFCVAYTPNSKAAKPSILQSCRTWREAKEYLALLVGLKGGLTDRQRANDVAPLVREMFPGKASVYYMDHLATTDLQALGLPGLTSSRHEELVARNLPLFWVIAACGHSRGELLELLQVV